MPERLECEVLQKVRYINTLTYLYLYTSINYYYYRMSSTNSTRV